ncbi:DUF3168 domain-containing protein [Streptomyces nitrosporeus]|uniref:DUF3168 domain-containing protein n=1 Tax=Streptomyces nitrosporeus TaxID=28894 RepID=UPI00167DD945|nr:DUF3168 domain-containing protein [Streptomyces nitrosporeus]GGZ28018.1 hypothetical protein GCM10010327_68110 [Streptomyces nitrosporeus]
MIAQSPLLPIQKAMYGALTGDSALMALATGVYDYVPETAAYPYIVIGEATEIPRNSHDRFGWETVPTLHVWDQYRGYARVLRIGSRIGEVLDHQALTIPGYNLVEIRFEFSQTLTDPEPPGDIRHLVLRHRIVTEQPPAAGTTL